MKTSTWLNLAAASGIITVLAIVAVLVPAEGFTPAVVCATVLLAASVGFLFYCGRAAVNQDESANLALAGPVGTLSFALVAGAGLALAAALLQHPTISFALDILTIGGFVAAWSILKVSGRAIARHVQAVETPSQHGVWQSRVSSMIALCPDAMTRDPLARLAESIRFAARDKPGFLCPENDGISAGIDTLEASLRAKDPAAVLDAVESITSALAMRELSLKSQRSKI